MSEINPREAKGVPDAISEEANAAKSQHRDRRRTEVHDDDAEDVTKLDPVAEEAEPLVKTDQARKESAA